MKTVKIKLVSKTVLWTFLVTFFVMGPGLLGLSAFLAYDRYLGSTTQDARIESLHERRGMRAVSYCPVVRLSSGELAMSAYCGEQSEFTVGDAIEVRVGSQVIPNTHAALVGNLLVLLGVSLAGNFLFVSSVLGYRKRRRFEKAGKVDADGFVTIPDPREKGVGSAEG